jgi:hypothetical protein
LPEGLATAPSPDKTFGDLFILDSGWGGLNIVAELAKQRCAALVHIKSSFTGYSKDELEKMLRGMPGSSFLKMRCVAGGVRAIAMAAKYNSKKTCFFSASEGVAPATPGKRYITKWPGANRNVMARNFFPPSIGRPLLRHVQRGGHPRPTPPAQAGLGGELGR